MPSRVRPLKRDPKPPRPPKPEPTPEPTPAPETEAAPGGGAVTMDTPIRDIGDVSEAAARRFLAGSPLEPHAAAIVAAAKGWSAMALAFAKKESSLGAGASARQTNNPLGLMRRTGDTRRCLQLAGGCLLHFPTWGDAFAEYAARIGSAPYDPSKSLKHNTLVFVGGPRCPDILAADPNGVCANGHRWDAGNPDTDLRTYVAQTVERINAIKAFDGTTPAPPVPTPTTDPYAVMFAAVPYRMGDFGWRTMTPYSDYVYGVNHGTTDARMHTGQDVMAAYGTPYHALGPGKVLCVGEAGTPLWGQNCGHFHDVGDAGPGAKQIGVGNVTILYDVGVKVTTGHTRQAFVKPGDRVTRGQKIGTVGGMRVAHLHIDTVIERAGTYLLIDPADGLRRVVDGSAPKPGPKPIPPVPATYDFSDKPWPKSVRVKFVPKPGEGAGFDRVPFRGPRMVGTCDHITAGGGTPEFIWSFFGTGGERQWDALTDSVLGRDGSALLLNDPWDEKSGGTRAGWANGGSNGLEGDGPAFVRALGIAAINGRLFSKEHIAVEGQALTDAQLETSIGMSAVVHQRAKTKWDQYPYNETARCMTAMEHYEFATKSCPAQPFRDTYGPIIRREVKALLKAWQTGHAGPTDPVDPKPPPTPDPLAPLAVTEADLALLFGELTRPSDGARLPFSPTGIISNAWLARVVKESQAGGTLIAPEADRWLVSGDKHFVTFEGGWTLFTPKYGDFAGFRWVGYEDLEEEIRGAAS